MDYEALQGTIVLAEAYYRKSYQRLSDIFSKIKKKKLITRNES